MNCNYLTNLIFYFFIKLIFFSVFINVTSILKSVIISFFYVKESVSIAFFKHIFMF